MTRLRPKEVFGKFEFRNMQRWVQAGKFPPRQVDMAVDRAVDLQVDRHVDSQVDRAVDLPCRLILAWCTYFLSWLGFWAWFEI